MTVGELKARLGSITGQSWLFRIGPNDNLPMTIRPAGEDFTLTITAVEYDAVREEIVLREAPE